MVALQYRGPTPGTDSSVVPKSWADGENATVVVTSNWVNSQIITEATNDDLQPQSYVDSEDALRAHKTDVDTADTLYVPTSKLGAANGVASLDSTGDLVAAQIPSGTLTDRITKGYDAATNGTIYLTSGNTHTVTTTTLREYKLASIPIPDPGYPWFPLPFALVGGYSSGPNPSDRTKGTGNLGLLTVMPPSGVSDTIYGTTACAGAYNVPSYYPLLPYGASGDTPTTVPAVQGALELDLWGCCFTLTSYIFTGTGLTFSVLVVPVMGAG
jgi:hypothetical protein